MSARALPILSALGFAAAAGLAPVVLRPWPAADATAFAFAALALVMAALAIDAPPAARSTRATRKDPP